MFKDKFPLNLYTLKIYIYYTYTKYTFISNSDQLLRQLSEQTSIKLHKTTKCRLWSEWHWEWLIKTKFNFNNCNWHFDSTIESQTADDGAHNQWKKEVLENKMIFFQSNSVDFFLLICVDNGNGKLKKGIKKLFKYTYSYKMMGKRLSKVLNFNLKAQNQ